MEAGGTRPRPAEFNDGMGWDGIKPTKPIKHNDDDDAADDLLLILLILLLFCVFVCLFVCLFVPTTLCLWVSFSLPLRESV